MLHGIIAAFDMRISSARISNEAISDYAASDSQDADSQVIVFNQPPARTPERPSSTR